MKVKLRKVLSWYIRFLLIFQKKKEGISLAYTVKLLYDLMKKRNAIIDKVDVKAGFKELEGDEEGYKLRVPDGPYIVTIYIDGEELSKHIIKK